MVTFRDFLDVQIKEIEVYKWIESEKVGYDLGVQAETQWVECFAKSFRDSMVKEYGEIK